MCDENAGCSDEYYMTNSRCCKKGDFFDLKMDKCSSIASQSKPCLQMSKGKCLKCVDDTDNYISNGVCVPNNYYWDSIGNIIVDTNASFSKFP